MDGMKMKRGVTLALWLGCAWLSAAPQQYQPEADGHEYFRGQPPSPKVSPPDNGKAAIAAIPDAASKVYPTCGNNLKTHLWAQLTVEADLMQTELKRIGLPAGHTKVAVLDTGFDTAANKSRMASPQFAVAKGHERSGKPEEDKGGHGTMVAGVIGGANGIGVAPDVDLTVYRVTSESSDSCTSDDLRKAAQRACDEGHPIINMSWGNLWDESGKERNEVSDKAFLDKLAEQGCLIVKAAGNSAYRADFTTNKLDDNYLRVAAISGAGTLSPFSSIGEVSAPGSAVFTLESTTTGYTRATDNDKLCSGKTGRFVNGTSFAAPITAGIAAEVRGVLNHLSGEIFSCLPGPDQIQLITGILKASEFLGTISGLRAVLLAERWSKHATGKMADVSQLKEWLRNDPPAFCAATAPEWKAATLADAAAKTRARLSACPWTETSSIEARNLVQVMSRSHNLELTLRWFPIFDSVYVKKEKAIFRQISDYAWKILERKWATNSTYGSIRFGMDFDEALTLLPMLAQTQSGYDGKKELTDRIQLFFKSWDFEDRMSRRNLRGSEEDYSRIHLLWKLLALEKLPTLPFEVIQSWTDENVKLEVSFQRLKGRVLLASFRLLADILDDADFKATHGKAQDYEWKLFQLVNQTNRIEIERAAEDKPDMIHLSFWDDMNNFYARYLDPFFARHDDKITKLLALNTEAPKLGTLNPFFVTYFAMPSPTRTDEFQAKLSLAVLKEIADGNGWNEYGGKSWADWIRSDDKLSQYGLQTLRTLAEKHKADPDFIQSVKQRYRALFENAQSFDFLATQMPNYGPDSRYFWTWMQEKNPFLEKPDVIDQGLRTFLAAGVVDKAIKLRQGFAIAEAVKASTGILGHRADARENGGYAFPLKLNPLQNRLLPAQLSQDIIGCSLETPQMVADFVNEWAKFFLTLNEEEKDNAYPSARVLQSVYEARHLCTNLPTDGEWRANLGQVNRIAEANYRAFGSNNFEVKWSSKRLLERCK